MDTSTSTGRIVITEYEDLDLDKLLLGDNSGDKASSPHARPSPPSSPSTESPTPASATTQRVGQTSQASPSLAGGEEGNSVKSVVKKASPPSAIIFPDEEGDEDDEDDDGAGHWYLPTPAKPGDYLSSSLRKPPIKSILKKAPPPPIFALEEEEEDEEDMGHWMLPPPAKPGNYLNSSSQNVPSKSILKTISSYAKLDSMDGSSSMGKRVTSHLSFAMDSSSTSQGSIGRNSRSKGKNSPNTSISRGPEKMSKKASFLGLDWSNSHLSQGSEGSEGAIGWDMDESPQPYDNFNNDLPANPSLPPMPNLRADSSDADTSGADRAAGMDSSGSRHSGTSNNKMRHNVSFHSVDVRMYDRTVGDNPSCRSGPPLALDWSYSKKTAKDLDEYESERLTNRVKSTSKLHVNKYKRKNLLAFHWGATEEELKEARRTTKKMQRQRSMTQLMTPVHMVEEAFISIKKFVKKKKKGGVMDDGDYVSDMSNSASTMNSNRHQRTKSGLSRRNSTGGTAASAFTNEKS